MDKLRKTVDDFTRYSRLAINAKKYHAVSYIRVNNQRIADEHSFIIGGEPIPNANLAE
jgi:NifB/MoaA-like Fe-S oxidoreductase